MNCTVESKSTIDFVAHDKIELAHNESIPMQYCQLSFQMNV